MAQKMTILFLIAAFLALLGAFFNKKSLFVFSFLTVSIGLAIRSVITGRPPVANLFESALFVADLLLLLSFLVKEGRSLAFIAALLLALSYKTPISENIQPALHSNFWLTVHVLTIVASYAFLLAASAVAHFQVLKKEPESKILASLLSIGTGLLLIGTLLGGLWATESWGRFWDWDPKEAWAFISSAIYLLAIHAWRLGKISSFGLSIFAILGGAAITFTWYGLNVVTTTGLHTYGFTKAPLVPYLLFLGAELAFALFATSKKYLQKKNH